MSGRAKAVELISNLLEYLNDLERNNDDETEETKSTYTEHEAITHHSYSKIRAATLRNKALCDELMEASIDWSLSNGFTMTSQTTNNSSIHAPHTLLPILLNLKQHTNLFSISLIFHKLIDALSHDWQFLISCIEKTAESDADFTGKMLDLFKKQISGNELQLTQKYQLGIFRSDYMKNALTDRWAQIEFNTISVSFGALSDLVFRLHKFLLSRYLNVNQRQLQELQPTMDVTREIASALGTAAKLVHQPGSNPIVLMVVQQTETNRSDQRLLEYALFNAENVRMIRRSLLYIYHNAELDQSTKELIVDAKYKISVVYYRAGYSPEDYGPDGYEWRAREMMELSNAIKCPSVGYHLIGSKMFQTIFSKRQVLLKYLTEKEAENLLSVFVKLYSLQDNDKDEYIQSIVKDAVHNSKNYVLKPQREGGDNNYYNGDIAKMINKLSGKELESYILMQRIYPAEIETIQIRRRQK